ncbi:hypothetical protein ACJX0J_033637, partial [Zea mays]
ALLDDKDDILFQVDGMFSITAISNYRKILFWSQSVVRNILSIYITSSPISNQGPWHVLARYAALRREGDGVAHRVSELDWTEDGISLGAWMTDQGISSIKIYS